VLGFAVEPLSYAQQKAGGLSQGSHVYRAYRIPNLQ
jgi:hypothetical protein